MVFETAESVTLGHPDKLADYIADSILDECLKQDPNSRVACEVLIAHDTLVIAGEITADAELNSAEVAEKAIRAAGYEPPRRIYRDIVEQSYDISDAVDGGEEQGAGDQGIVYGYATDETLSRLPLATDLAHRLTEKLMQTCYGLNDIGIRPDGKAQVTVAYGEDGKFSHIASVLISVQHDEEKDVEELRRQVQSGIIDPVLYDFDTSKTEFIINPSGRFVKGGFEADTGLTGRKLMVDTYGGLAHHGGGAMSGKDPSKVDRSGAYMARYIANAIVVQGLAKKCEVSIAYAIGKPQPTAVNVDTFGTWQYAPDRFIAEAVKKAFDLTPAGIEKELKLTKIGYADTAAHGHFGAGKSYPWEQISHPLTDRLSKVLHDVLDEGINR